MRKITKEIFNLLEGSNERVEYDDEVLQYLYDETTYDIDRYGKVQNINFPDYDYFNDYIMDIDKNVYNDAKKRLEDLLNNVKFYNDSEGSGTYLELSDNHTMYDLEDNGKSEEEWYSIIDSKSVEFENETNVPLRFLGRSARHICVDINLSNIVNYDKLKEVQNRLEDEAIAEFNDRELESTINESKDNSLASEISKYIRDNFNINPEIDFNPNSTSSDIKKYLNTIKSGIKLFDKSGISVDKIVIGYPIASDNGVLNNKYGILFTVDAAGSKINSFILSHSVINVDEIGRELFNIKSLSKQLSNSGGKDIFKKSMNNDWVLEGTKDNLMLYYVGHNREKAIYKIIELESTSSRVNEGSEVKSQSGIVEESEDIEERRTRGIDKSIERIKSEIDRVDREHKSCTDEDRGKKLANKMEDLVTRLNKLEAYKEISLKEDKSISSKKKFVPKQMDDYIKSYEEKFGRPVKKAEWLGCIGNDSCGEDYVNINGKRYTFDIETKEIKESDDINGALANDINKVADIESGSDEDSTLDNINEPRYGVIYDCIFRSGDIMARQYQIQSPEGFSLLLKLEDSEPGTWIDVNRVEPDDWTWEFNQYIFSNDSVEDEEAKERQHLIEEKYGEDVLQIIYDFARYFKLDKDDLDESSLEEDVNKVVIRNYADSDGEIDLDVTDNEIDILVAFSFDFNDSDDSYYSQFMNILANNVEVDSFSGGILNCKFSDYFKKYNDKLADLFEPDGEEAYVEAVVNLELLLPGFAGEEIYKKLVDILKGINESSDSYEQKRISDDEAYDRYKRNHPEELNYDLYSQPMEVVDEINSGIYGMTWDELLNDYEENPESDAYIDIIREAKKSLWLKNHINK